MRCETFETRVNDLLDARRSPADDPRIVEHRRKCANCAAVFDSYQRLLDNVDSWSPLEMDGELAPRVLSQWSESRRRRRFWLRGMLSVAVAASLLVVVVVWSKDPPAENLMVDATPAPPPNGGATHDVGKIPVGEKRPVEAVRGGDDGVAVAVADAAGDGLAGIVRMLPGVGVGREEVELVTPPVVLPDQVGESPFWVTKVNDELKPLADTMVAALGALRRTLPNPPPDRPSS